MRIKTRDLRIADRDLGVPMGPLLDRAPAPPAWAMRGAYEATPGRPAREQEASAPQRHASLERSVAQCRADRESLPRRHAASSRHRRAGYCS